MKLSRIALAASFALASFAAQAQDLYGEVGYSALKYSESGQNFNVSFTPSTLRGIIGMNVAPHLAVEGLLALSLDASEAKENGINTGIKGKVDQMLGIFVKPHVTLGDTQLFARVGYTSTKVSANTGGSDSDSSLSYGVGVSYAVNKTVSINADYTTYYNKDNTKIDGVTVGVGFKF